ncbi:MAG: helix-turn-helix domain-containing protein [Oscillospiraceae bacterium]|nr:helix-turn-helix domain-containing protein [Oscillospiraceae bacterium]
MDKIFSAQLKKAMELRNMSQTQLCGKTGIPKSAMSQYVSGAFRPKQERTYLIAQALQTTPEYLMGFTDSIDIPKSPLGIIEGLRNSSAEVARNMKMIMESQNISQKELAIRSSLPIEKIKKYEAGDSQIDIDDLLPIADALGTSIAALTGILIPYYDLSDEGRHYLYHNSPTPEEMGMGMPFPNDEAGNKIVARILKMTPEQREKLLDILIAFKMGDE